MGITSGIISGIQPGLNPSAGGGGGSDPDSIFGASLSSWFRADVGVTESGGLVSDWANQATAGDASQTSAGAKPLYVASGTDGTPEIDMRLKFFNVSLPIASEFTVYAFINQGTAAVRSLLWDGSRGIYPGGLTAERPSIFNGAWHTSTDSNLGWHLNRFSVRINTSGDSSIAVDANAEQTYALTAVHAGPWTEMGRSTQTPDFYAKQILIVDELIDDGDSRNDDILTYFKSEFPTLATW